MHKGKDGNMERDEPEQKPEPKPRPRPRPGRRHDIDWPDVPREKDEQV